MRSSRGHKRGARRPSHERWLVTYGDLLTLLLAFFVVMFAIANTDLEKFRELVTSLQRAFGRVEESAAGAEVTPPALEGSSAKERDFQAIQAQVKEFLARNAEPLPLEAYLTDEGIVLVLSGTLLFPSGDAELRPEGIPLLQEVITVLQRLDNPIRVEGHTDNVPVSGSRFPSNQALSQARAARVARYLEEEGGVAPERITTVGYGDARPVASNDTPAGRARNRRSAIVIIYPPGAPRPTMPVPMQEG